MLCWIPFSVRYVWHLLLIFATLLCCVILFFFVFYFSTNPESDAYRRHADPSSPKQIGPLAYSVLDVYSNKVAAGLVLCTWLCDAIGSSSLQGWFAYNFFYHLKAQEDFGLTRSQVFVAFHFSWCCQQLIDILTNWNLGFFVTADQVCANNKVLCRVFYLSYVLTLTIDINV